MVLPISSGFMLSGAAFCTSMLWLGGGWEAGACGGTSVEVLEVEADDVEPIPGVKGPMPFRDEGACGEGASGTACWSAGVCCGVAWADAAELRMNDKLRNAVSASVLRPRSTGILSSPYDTAPADCWPADAPSHRKFNWRGSTRQSIRRAAALQVCPSQAERVKL